MLVDMKKNIHELDALLRRKAELDPIVHKGYSTKEEFLLDGDLQSAIAEYHEIQKRISQILWDQKTDVEKQAARRELIGLANKFSDKANDKRIEYMENYFQVVQGLMGLLGNEGLREEARGEFEMLLRLLQEFEFKGLNEIHK
jgi:hypothetical protein